MAAVVDPEECTGRETCIGVRPAAAISMEDDLARVDPDLCVDECPAGAISLA
ncbi:MAG: ferredoxin [Methanoculleus sp.]